MLRTICMKTDLVHFGDALFCVCATDSGSIRIAPINSYHYELSTSAFSRQRTMTWSNLLGSPWRCNPQVYILVMRLLNHYPDSLQAVIPLSFSSSISSLQRWRCLFYKFPPPKRSPSRVDGVSPDAFSQTRHLSHYLSLTMHFARFC
jgi:hypothetical protein